MKLRMEAYRRFQSWVVEPWILPRWMSEERIAEEREKGLLQTKLPARKKGRARAWFHAASVGELESLTPVLEAWLRDGSEAIVSVLSESARGTVARFRNSEWEGRVLYAGYSPWDGRWLQALKAAKPDVFLTAKYEAWPELWGSLAQLQIPLLIVGAKARRSLRIAGTLCKALGGSLPSLTLLTARQEDMDELRTLFSGSPEIRVALTGEPRWDRVQARAKQGSARARELIVRYAAAPRPWGVLAQVWPEDMEVWRGRFARAGGAIWVVPHRVEAEHVDRIEHYLLQAGLRVQRTSKNTSEGAAECILVDEMGVLLELYSAADWVYVGGGFGVSMHSTIEPALYGLPVCCGPHGADQFAEVSELRGTGQLSVLSDGDELDRWLEELAKETSDQVQLDARRQAWRTQAQERLGATERVLEFARNAARDSLNAK